MNRFEHIHFSGTFRSFQQRVLDNADKYLKDGKINIVAAPGSGKTVLGLELIRYLGAPCIIFSPTTAIRQQWGVRFRDLFLENKEEFDALFSYDLHNIKLLNSVTYQALYTAMEKVSSDEGDVDCSDIDILGMMKEFGIKTICLDEAHHLKNEWQKALEKFLSALNKDTKIISLTATPPYDSEGSEWSRYMSICGEIDEEIFIPELVAQDTLCTHQDYVYFNYPTETEMEGFYTFKARAMMALEEIGKLDVFQQLCEALNVQRDYEALFASPKEYIALATVLHFYRYELDKKLVHELTIKKGLPVFSMEYAETAIQFLLKGKLITEEQKNKIIDILKKNGVYEKRKVTFHLNERLKRALISSVGKLNSIKKIARSEIDALGEQLRMLILTDYIKKEELVKVATAEEFHALSVVSIFETLRRENPNAAIGVLSGTLVILPKWIALSDIKHKKTDILNTDYCIVEFSGSVHHSVDYVGKLFEKGMIQILVGTKSLLGEGWDSPCINSLILASFVGSFVLSNQMRGRAIRVNKNDPDKSSNIWHLVTIEPEYLFRENVETQDLGYITQEYEKIVSYDYDMLKRRFDAFMGPNYTTGVIESGIERITTIKPPYDKSGIEQINHEMLALSRRRNEIKAAWKGEVADKKFAVRVETDIPKEMKVPVFTLGDYALNTALIAIESFMLRFLTSVEDRATPLTVGIIVIMMVLSVVLYYGIKKWVRHSNPVNSIKTLGITVYETLCECGLISPSAKVETSIDEKLQFVSLRLQNASIHDQNIFNIAITEMLSPIENPRYILIAKTKSRRYNYALSFACPSIIGSKKEYVTVLVEKLKETTCNFESVYMYREDGRRFLLKCRKYSYITRNEMAMGKKYRVSHWE